MSRRDNKNSNEEVFRGGQAIKVWMTTKGRDAPYVPGEEDKPHNVKHDGTAEENGVSSPEALAVALDGNEGKECNNKVNDQDTVVQCSQRSHEGAANLEETNNQSITINSSQTHVSVYIFITQESEGKTREEGQLPMRKRTINILYRLYKMKGGSPPEYR